MKRARDQRIQSAWGAAAALLVAVAVAFGNVSSSAAVSSVVSVRPQLETPTVTRLAEPVATLASPALDARGLRRIASMYWRGGRYPTAAGGSVNISVSSSYAADPGAAARWADFFASLVHGSELELLNAYIAPLAEVQTICGGNSDVLGCYGANRLVTVGDSSGGIPPESVAAHEYGHHIANNRLNPPWVAENWGTKRWATDMNICARATAGTAFPGAEDADYPLNPGEAFAESYRVLNETLAGAPLTWPILDNSFRPDATALQAIRDDILQPWSAATTQTIHGRFAPRRNTWTRKLATPLDGSLSIQLGVGADGLQLLSADNQSILGQGVWTQTGRKSIDYQICGQRSFTVRVSRSSPTPTFTLRISIP
jgi:hypothetical protein